MEKSAGCELRRSPGLAGEFGPDCGPVRAAFPRRCLAFLWATLTGSRLRATLGGSAKRFAAVTCAVSIPPYSRASATAFLRGAPEGASPRVQPEGLPVFPSTKLAMSVRGARPAVDDDVPRPKTRRRGGREKL